MGQRPIILALLLFPSVLFGYEGPQWPQVKIDRVDGTNPSKWRVFFTVVGEKGEPLEPKELDSVSLYLKEGRKGLQVEYEKPLLRFTEGRPAKGYSGKILSLAKSEVQQAVVIVVAGHAEVPQRVRDALPKAVEALLKGLKPDAKVTIMVYGDDIKVLWSPDGQRGEWRDLDDYQHCLGRMRKEAQGEKGKQKDSTLCGDLFASPKAVAPFLGSMPVGQGLFPKLLGIAETKEVLEIARRYGHTRVRRRLHQEEEENLEPFGQGAVMAAIRLLLAQTPSQYERLVVLLSDGKDGYLRVTQIAQERLAKSPECAKVAMDCDAKVSSKKGQRPDHEGGSKECTREVLECSLPRIAKVLRRREETVAEHLLWLIPMAKAAGVRIEAIAIPGTEAVGMARLQALSIKTGGLLRTPETSVAMIQEASKLSSRLSAMEGVIEAREKLEPKTTYSAAVVVGNTLRSTPFVFTTGPRVWFFEGPLSRARAFAVARLGHTFGPPAFYVVAALATLMLLFFALKMGKALVGIVKAMGKKAKPPKVQVKVPTLKRPGQ